LFLEALLKEKGILRIGGCGGNHKESIPLGWAKESTQKVCRGRGSRRTRARGRWGGVEWSSSAGGRTIRMKSSNKGRGG